VVYKKWVQAFRSLFGMWDQQGLRPLLREFMQDVAVGNAHAESYRCERALNGFSAFNGKKLFQQKSLELDSKKACLPLSQLAIQKPQRQPDGGKDPS